MPKTHPLIKDRDGCRPGHVIFVSFPSSFPLTRVGPSASRLARPFGFGSPADGKRRIVAPIVLCVGAVPKQNKMAIETEIENNFVYYLNSKCCRVPLNTIDI